MRNDEIEKIFVWIVKVGLLAVLILPLYISSGMLFPFITGKNFFFRIIVEIAFVFWVGLAALRREYLPKLTPLFKSATVFIVILFFADLFSPNSYRAFFSNFERMEGFLMLSHLYLYFIMLLSVFKTRKDWLIFFHTTLIVSFIVGFVGLLQLFGLRVSTQGGYRIDSTIGNPAYLASYLSFHVWILAILLRNYWQKIGLRIFYISALLFELLIIYFTATRGTTIALFLSALLLFGAAVFYWKRLFTPEANSYRKFAGALLVLLLILPIVFWQFRKSSWIPSNSTISRLASISLTDTTTQARFSIWKMSWRGFLERPILGWGQENYYLVFQKYFDPKLHSSEPWFDRSHNIVFDWLVHAGAIGFISFFSILGSAVWLTLRGLRRGSIVPWEGLLILLAFSTHLFENLFVFDNLNTYLLYFGFLAYAGFLDSSPARERRPYVAGNSRTPILFLLGFTALLAVLAIYFFNTKPMRTSGALVRGLMAYQRNLPMSELKAAFEKAISFQSVGITEVREQMGNTARDMLLNNRYNSEERAVFVDLTIQELKKEVAIPARDIKHMIFLASILARAGEVNPAYPAEAERILKEAIHLSPTKQILYFELAQLYLSQNMINESIELLRKTMLLDPTYQQAVVNLLAVGTLAGKTDIAKEASSYVRLEDMNEEMLQKAGVSYQRLGDLNAAKNVFAKLTEVSPKNPKYRATAAALLANAGEYDRAIAEAKVAAELDPEFASEAQIFIQQMEERKRLP